MEDGVVKATQAGTPQGAVVSPLLANIYLHYVFDLWANRWRHRQARGHVIIVRYADDIVVGFEHKADARAVPGGHAAADGAVRTDATCGQDPADRVRSLRGVEPRQQRGLGKPETFNFLGFTHICGRSARGRFRAHATKPPRPNARHVASPQGSAVASHALAHPRAGTVVRTGGPRILPIPRGTHQHRQPGCVQVPRDGSLATRAQTAQPEGPDNVGAHDTACG